MLKETENAAYEIVGEWFFPSPVYTKDGIIVPAPLVAIEKYEEEIGNWLRSYPENSGTPHVSIFPVIGLDKEGYKVQIEVFRNLTSINP